MKIALHTLLAVLLVTQVTEAQNADLPFTSGSTGADGALTFPSYGSANINFGLVYDAARQEVVRFGGGTLSASYSNLTQIWNGTTWATRSTQAAPTARYRAAMAYDAARQVTVLFGGETGQVTNGQLYSSDTWTFNGVNWTGLSPATVPPGRQNARCVYDAARQEVVMFGGRGVNATLLSDTWVWNGTNWASRSPATVPPTRADQLMAYDEMRQEVVMFGGEAGGPRSDTWTWNGTNWTQKSSVNVPTARSSNAMAYVPSRQKVMMFGGGGATTGTVYGDAWEWDGTEWTQMAASDLPPARRYHSLVHDAARGELLVVHGNSNGQQTGQLDDTWGWKQGVWTKRAGSTMTFDLTSDPDSIWNFTTVTIPAGITVNFKRNPANTPVVWLATDNVQILGTLQLTGQSGDAAGGTGQNGISALGGAGGYDGGEGGISSATIGKNGSGPGGGGGGGGDLGDGANATHVGTYGSAFALPLQGGSGGGGGNYRGTNAGGKGGGGGGALFIASSRDVTLSGSIVASGGSGKTATFVSGTKTVNGGGHGSGGTVRLVADRILASTGTIQTNDGAVALGFPNANPGRVRLEGYARQVTAANITGSLSQSVPTDVPAVLQSGGRLRVKSVDGQEIAAHPTADLVNPDVIFSNANATTITVEALNIPNGTAATLKIVHSNGNTYNLPEAGSVTIQNGIATFTATIPAGSGTLQASANYTVGQNPPVP